MHVVNQRVDVSVGCCLVTLEFARHPNHIQLVNSLKGRTSEQPQQQATLSASLDHRLTMRPVLISAYIILAFLFAVWPRQTIATSLYSTEDPIEQLLASNFGQKITGAENAWLIEFYAVWCGHCQRFAKIYKELANYVKGTWLTDTARKNGYDNEIW